METFATQRYEGKIENFDTCMIDGNNTQQHIEQSASEVTVHDMNTLEGDQNQEESVNEQDQSTSIIQNSERNVTLTPVRLPAILDGEFFSVVKLEDSNVTARCLQCNKLLNGNLKSTGNFLSHIKRVHPFLMEKIKTKSNQRRPAAIYIDLSAQEKCQEYKQKLRFKKFPKHEEFQSNENSFDQVEWLESPNIKKRKSQESATEEMIRIHHNNSVTVEDEYDAIGKNVAAKLRHMGVDQRIIAEKLLNDILFEAQLGNLHRNSSINV
ncbi:uncharacterized protein LOC106636261 [Copidosoma floridanum]|uniref:uncharacterized protein LOC106636261 n=1 Tax=Copidosoma floridanum TaxID=29053 RepID=UPI0006C99716|nr:uncharacterized protein LOC106636261 [Copidosoma floridanum]